MRKLALPAAALLLAGAVVLVGGRIAGVRHAVVPVAVQPPEPDKLTAVQDVVESTSADDVAAKAPPVGAVSATPEAIMDRRTLANATGQVSSPEIDTGAEALTAEPSEVVPPSRLVAPTEIAPPQLGSEGLRREPPRAPLSQLSLALPPPPPPEFKNPWAGKPLFRPVAIASAIFESGGHTIAIDGVESIGMDESCDYEGASWPCGVRARAAFRLWLRGRALVCQIPEAERNEDVMRGACRLAKQDVGEWLVENGWALAAPGSAYVQAEEKARAAKLGIFGAPPDTSSVSPVPDAPIGLMGESQPVMTEESTDPQPSADPRMAFPPAPPQP